MPRTTIVSAIWVLLDSILRRLNRKRDKLIKVVPVVHSSLGPILSDNQPLSGAITSIIKELMARSNPDSRAE